MITKVIILTSMVTLLEARGTSKDVYTSSGELINIFKMEQEMVDLMAKHKQALEEQINAIKKYTDEVESVYKNEGCWPADRCSEDDLLQVIVGNPIYCYQLLKRLNFDLKKLESSLKGFDTSGTVLEVKRIARKFGGLPNESDLHGAAKALNRLQDIYRFNISEFSVGNIMGHQTSAELGVKDTFFLGRSVNLWISCF